MNLKRGHVLFAMLCLTAAARAEPPSTLARDSAALGKRVPIEQTFSGAFEPRTGAWRRFRPIEIHELLAAVDER